MDRNERTAARAGRLDRRLRVYRGVALLGLASLLATALAAWLPGVYLIQRPEEPRASPPAVAPSCGCGSGRGAAGTEPRTAGDWYTARRNRRPRLSVSPPLHLKHSPEQSLDAEVRGTGGAGVAPHADPDRLDQRDYEASLDGAFW